MNEEFRERLKETFQNARMSDIARRLGLPHATVRNYFAGRLPAPDVLMKIAQKTNISLNWLLLGAGEMYVSGPRPIDLDKIFEEKIGEIIELRLGSRKAEEPQGLGSVDGIDFDVEAAVRKWQNPERVMNGWFQHEGREYPTDYGVIFFEGWNSYTDEEKIAAVCDAKSVLDRSLKKK